MSRRLAPEARLRALSHLHASQGVDAPPERRVRGATEWAVLSALTSYSRPGQPVWPSQWELAQVAHLSVRSVQRALKWLVARGVVAVVDVPPRDRLRGQRTVYSLPVEPVEPVRSADWRPLDSERRAKWWSSRDPKVKAEREAAERQAAAVEAERVEAEREAAEARARAEREAAELARVRPFYAASGVACPRREGEKLLAWMDRREAWEKRVAGALALVDQAVVDDGDDQAVVDDGDDQAVEHVEHVEHVEGVASADDRQRNDSPAPLSPARRSGGGARHDPDGDVVGVRGNVLRAPRVGDASPARDARELPARRDAVEPASRAPSLTTNGRRKALPPSGVEHARALRASSGGAASVEGIARPPPPPSRGEHEALRTDLTGGGTYEPDR